VFTADDAVEESDKGNEVLLIRPETSPADVHGMAVSQGIITATGGLASHAAVVARGWGIPAVVGVSTLTVNEDSAVFGDVKLTAGETITLDGTTGEIFHGDTEIEASQTLPTVTTFIAWLDEALDKIPIETSPGASPEEKLRIIQNIRNVENQ